MAIRIPLTLKLCNNRGGGGIASEISFRSFSIPSNNRKPPMLPGRVRKATAGVLDNSLVSH